MRLKGIKQKIIRINAKVIAIIQLLFLKKKMIYLFGCPLHPNMGDQAQTYCIENWLRVNYPEYGVFFFNWNTSSNFAFFILKKKIKRHDLLFGHSGYFFIDHHLELPVYRKVAKTFKNNPFVIFPQTINLKTESGLKETRLALNNHSNITLLCRDEVSFEKAKEIFSSCNLLLYPDIVTSLIGTKRFSFPREGVLFCLRNDSEAFYKPKEMNELREKIDEILPTELMDTNINLPYRKIRSKREELIHEMLTKFAKYRLVITDRYHGTIFSLISCTPTIVISSVDHKLESGVKWFPESFKPYIRFAQNLEEAYVLASEMINRSYDYKLPTYFHDEYYSKLKKALSSKKQSTK